ncbi:MAG: hypothetical protein HUU60_05595 [Armatimonadetes bacterium]|nr:hypothetical protein [Armatimonadota bacterium]
MSGSLKTIDRALSGAFWLAIAVGAALLAIKQGYAAVGYMVGVGVAAGITALYRRMIPHFVNPGANSILVRRRLMFIALLKYPVLLLIVWWVVSLGMVAALSFLAGTTSFLFLIAAAGLTQNTNSKEDGTAVKGEQSLPPHKVEEDNRP